VRDALVRRVAELHIARDRDTPNDEDEDELMRQLPFVEELERRCRAERRLRRDLSSVEREALRERLAQLGDRALDDALDLDARVLEAWLARATG